MEPRCRPRRGGPHGWSGGGCCTMCGRSEMRGSGPRRLPICPSTEPARPARTVVARPPWPAFPPQDYLGQLTPEFQAMLARERDDIELADCDFYHASTLADGTVIPGPWDLRGGESNYLGNIDVAGDRVLELGPADRSADLLHGGRGRRGGRLRCRVRCVWRHAAHARPGPQEAAGGLRTGHHAGAELLVVPAQEPQVECQGGLRQHLPTAGRLRDASTRPSSVPSSSTCATRSWPCSRPRPARRGASW